LPTSSPHKAPGLPALASVLLALVLAGLLTPIVMLPRLLPDAAAIEIGEAAPLSVRVSPFEVSTVAQPGSAMAMVRGDSVSAAQRQFAVKRQTPTTGRWATVFALLLAATLAWTAILRTEPRSSGLRQHLADAGLVVLLAAGSAAVLLLTPLSIFALPIGSIALLSAYRNSRRCALAVGGLSAVALGSMGAGAPEIVAILATQAIVPALWLRRRSSFSHHFVATAAAAVAGLSIYALLYFAAWAQFPTSIQLGLASWLCAGLGPFVSLGAAVLMVPAYTALRGDTSSRTLSRLEKLSQPLLRDLAQKAPGSWQHSLAMAKLAEAAGSSIGADTQLLRVGAYYHDIGKVTQPRYFIENISGSEHSVHENVPAIDSCKGIVGHVSKGVELGRSAGLPEQVIDFVRTHHGQGLLEYFWTKEQLSDSHALKGAHDESDFRYPGHLPNSPETGILCICDAIEGATRPLKSPTPDELSNLVHHIVFGKVRTGQLAHSGLSLKDLQNISNALSMALQAAHAPVARKSGNSQESSTAPGSARARPGARRPSIAGLSGIRLDSHDRPSNSWRHLPKSSQSGRIQHLEAHAATESLTIDGTDDTALAIESEGEITEDLAEVITEDLSEAGDQDTLALTADEDAPTADENAAEAPDEARANAETRGLRGTHPPSVDSRPKSKPQPNVENADLEGVAEDEEKEPAAVAEAKAADAEAAPRKKAKAAETPVAAEEEASATDLAARKSGDENASAETRKPNAEQAEATPKEAPQPNANDAEVASKTSEDAEAALSETTAPAETTVPALEIPVAEMPFLLTDLKRNGPPTPPPSRRNTIPLGKNELLIEPAPIGSRESQPSRRADSQDGLRPGEMVIGAPPATHPERGSADQKTADEKTALRQLPVPDEARRPEDRITEEQLALKPPASWGDPTAPVDARRPNDVDPEVEPTIAKTDRPGHKKRD